MTRWRAPEAACRRAARLVAMLVAAWTLVLPLALGPAERVLVDLAADSATPHQCSCGMRQGACGCPECELVVFFAVEVDGHDPMPALRSHCGRDDARPTAAPSPPALPASALADARPPSLPRVLDFRPPPSPGSQTSREPSTPPPKSPRVG